MSSTLIDPQNLYKEPPRERTSLTFIDFNLTSVRRTYTFAKLRGEKSLICLPFICMKPERGLIRLLKVFNKVDFPLYFSPTNKTSPLKALKLKSFRIGFLSYPIESLDISRINIEYYTF